MKMVALPKGQQRGIHGPAINVPTRIDTICKILPRLPSDSEIVPMKLKRRLHYKGHYMFDKIRPDAIKQALQWLRS